MGPSIQRVNIRSIPLFLYYSTFFLFLVSFGVAAFLLIPFPTTTRHGGAVQLGAGNVIGHIVGLEKRADQLNVGGVGDHNGHGKLPPSPP
jgi:hypothetical protein